MRFPLACHFAGVIQIVDQAEVAQCIDEEFAKKRWVGVPLVPGVGRDTLLFVSLTFPDPEIIPFAPEMKVSKGNRESQRFTSSSVQQTQM